jgi:predicted membrane-bound spermidine synthase
MKKPHAGLPFAFAAIGALAVVHQTILVREFLAVFSGNELTLALVLAGWLLGVALGAWSGGALGRKPGLAEIFLFLGTAALIAAGPLSVLIVRDARDFLSIPVGQYASFEQLALAALLIGVPSAFPVGFLFPVAGTVASELGKKSTSIGSVYTWEALGATLGGLIFTFILAGKTDHFTALALFGVITVSAQCCFFFSQGNRKIGLVSFAAAAALVIAIFGGAFAGLEQRGLKLRWENGSPGVELVENRDSRYQNVAIGRIAEQYSLYGNGEVVASFPDPTTYRAEAHYLATQHPDPESVLLIGAGSEGLVRYLLEHNIKRIDLVENDSIVTSLLDRYLPEEDKRALADDAVHRHAMDGRFFIDRSRESYDLIVIKMPDPSTAMINRFYTKDFFASTSKLLGKGGVLSISVTSAVNYYGEDVGLYAGSIFATLKSVFANVVAGPGDVARFFASNDRGACTDDWTVLQSRYLERGLPEDDYSTVMFKIFLPPDRVEHFRTALKSFSGVRINTDAKPVTYFYNLLLWDRFASGDFTPVLRSWSEAGPTGSILLVVGIGLFAAFAVFVLRRSGREELALKLRSGWTIAATGFAGMGLEVLLLLAFQNNHGSLYERIGLLVAMYMLGLGIGGGVVTSSRHARRNPMVWLIAAELALLLSALILSRIVLLPMGQIFFYGAVLLTAVFAGAQFPLAAALVPRSEEDVAGAAGLIDWADHLGAMLGAAVTGVLLIPIFGLGATCVVIAALKTAGLAGLVLNRQTARQ